MEYTESCGDIYKEGEEPSITPLTDVLSYDVHVPLYKDDVVLYKEGMPSFRELLPAPPYMDQNNIYFDVIPSLPSLTPLSPSSISSSSSSSSSSSLPNLLTPPYNGKEDILTSAFNMTLLNTDAGINLIILNLKIINICYTKNYKNKSSLKWHSFCSAFKNICVTNI